MAKATSSTRADLHQEVTSSIIAALKDGNIPWIRPGKSFPTNRVTGNPYHGLNVILLWLRANAMNYPTDRWLTFKQGEALGAHVRKGERGVKCIKYNLFEKKEKDPVTGVTEVKKIPVLMSFTVFNEAQFEELPESAVTVEQARGNLIADLLATGMTVRTDSRIRYDELTDVVSLPEVSAFETEDMYAATLAHLTIHWTGNSARLKRDVTAKPGLNAHAFEEMVAEMGAAFLCAAYGVPSLAHHVDMVRDWLEVLESDKTAVFKAAKHANKAVEFIHEQRVAPAIAV